MLGRLGVGGCIASLLFPRLFIRLCADFEVVLGHHDEHQVEDEEGAEEDEQDEEDYAEHRARLLQHVHQVAPALERDAHEDVGERRQDPVKRKGAALRVVLQIGTAGPTAAHVGAEGLGGTALYGQHCRAGTRAQVASLLARRVDTSIVKAASKRFDADDAEDEHEETEELDHVEQGGERGHERADKDAHALDALNRAQRPQDPHRAQHRKVAGAKREQADPGSRHGHEVEDVPEVPDVGASALAAYAHRNHFAQRLNREGDGEEPLGRPLPSVRLYGHWVAGRHRHTIEQDEEQHYPIKPPPVDQRHEAPPHWMTQWEQAKGLASVAAARPADDNVVDAVHGPRRACDGHRRCQPGSRGLLRF
mmetsp:Transcript_27628/g.89215  ORF Transcript_27628/g.89215 Transcript_27628/m.89215 type:complete len:364 (-) Transcript_27628:90-1181(-)